MTQWKNVTVAAKSHTCFVFCTMTKINSGPKKRNVMSNVTHGTARSGEAQDWVSEAREAGHRARAQREDEPPYGRPARVPSCATLPAGEKLRQLNGVVNTLSGVIGCFAPARTMMLVRKKAM